MRRKNKIFGRKSKPWYAEGLRFQCTQCGRCCSGAPGYVFVTPDEIEAIAAHLKMPLEEFMGRYVRRTSKGFSLTERVGGDCVMLQDGDAEQSAGCRIYAVRPTQCRTWPFWPSNLASQRVWQRVARRCPGIGTGPLYSLEEIEERKEALKEFA